MFSPNDFVYFASMVRRNGVYAIVHNGWLRADLPPITIRSFKFVLFSEVDFVGIAVVEVMPQYCIIFTHDIILLQ